MMFKELKGGKKRAAAHQHKFSAPKIKKKY
jgi:hypothetical protein